MGELARQPGCPELAATPLELLTPRPDEKFPVFQKWCFRVGGALFGVFTAIGFNYNMRRPFWAGIHYHIIFAGLGVCGVELAWNLRAAANAEADEVLRHYISLHPEDFPPFERVRFRDVYKPFQPVR